MSASSNTGLSKSSSSDSEDEQEKERLREASFNSFTTDTTGSSSLPNRVKNKSPWKEETNSKRTRPSLRNSLQSEDDFSHVNADLRVTSEVKAFIARKLSQSLDQSIELLEEVRQIDKPPSDDSSEGGHGFQMFSQKTTKHLEAQREAKRQKLLEARKKRQKRVSSSDSSEEEARLAEAAVSADFVLQHSAIKPTTVSTETGSYSKHDGKIEINHSKADSTSFTGDESNRNKNNHCESDSENEKNTVKKCKKKKKKQRYNGFSDEESSNVSLSKSSESIKKKKKKKKCKHSHSE